MLTKIFALLAISILLFSCGIESIQENEIKGEPNEYFFAQRAYPSGKISNESYRQAVDWKKEKTTNLRGAGDEIWKSIGPTNIGGRLTCVEANHNNSDVIYVGSASGGIFKTLDRGQSWTPIFEDAGSLAIGDLCIAPSDTSIIYVGTGESNAGGGSLAYDGDGIYRSNDAGASWTNIGLPEAGSIGRLLVHPTNPDIVYVAAMGYLFENNPNRGVYKTIDGGVNWEQSLFVTDSTGAIDLAMHPSNPNIIYATMWERVRRPDRRRYGGVSSGLYKSTDGGEIWNLINIPFAPNIKGRMGVATNPGAPEDLALYISDGTGFTNSILYSSNAGVSFDILPLPDVDVSFNWWFGRLVMDPHQPGDIIHIGLNLSRYSAQSKTWSGVFTGVHVDQHDYFIHPTDSGVHYAVNDGGLYISDDAGLDWSHINNLPITQFYTCEIDPIDPGRHYGGAQDNGSNRSLSDQIDSWEFIFGGDGFINIVDPNDNNTIYVEFQYGNLYRSDDDAQNWTAVNDLPNDPRNWNTPVVLDPTNSSILYYGTNRVYKSINKGGFWFEISPNLAEDLNSGNLVFKTVTTISVSPLDSDIIYAGTDNGKVWVTEDGGSIWNKISTDLPDRWITSVVADPTDPDIAYVTVSGFRYNEYDSHIFMTEDKGVNWQSVGLTLPDIPINKVIPHPIVEGTLFIATDIGVFISENKGQDWMALGNGLPQVPITDIDLDIYQQKLLAASYGRGMYTYDLSTNVSVNPNPLISINIYPNPTSGYLKIESKSTLEDISLSDLTGNVILSNIQLSNNQSIIDIGSLSSGIYILRAQSNDKSFSTKIIKI